MNALPPTQSTTLPSTVNHSIENGFKENIEESPYRFVESKSPKQNKRKNSDAFVVSRFVTKRHDRQHIEDNHYSSRTQPVTSIIEHNGKQFCVTPKQRTEHRYVQCFDEATHTMRLFEVTDYIPTRSIRPYRYNNQSQSNTESSKTTPFATPRSKQRPTVLHISQNRSPDKRTSSMYSVVSIRDYGKEKKLKHRASVYNYC